MAGQKKKKVKTKRSSAKRPARRAGATRVAREKPRDLDVGQFSLSRRRKTIWVNTRLAEWLGTSTGEQPLPKLVLPGELIGWFAEWTKGRNTDSADSLLHEVVVQVGPPGKARKLMFRCLPPADRRADAVAGIVMDVGDRRPPASREDLEVNRLHSFFLKSPLVTWIKDADGKYLAASQYYERKFGFAPGSWLGKTDFDLWPVKFARDCRAIELDVLESGEARYSVGPVDGMSQERSYWLLYRFLFTDGSGKRLLGGVAADVTERRRMEKSIADSEHSIKDVADDGPVLVWIKNRKFEYTYVSGSFGTFFGIESESIIGTTDEAYFPAESAMRFRENDQKVLKSGKTLEAIESTPEGDGSLRFWWVFKFRFTNAHGEKFVCGVAVNITERKRAEDKLRLMAITDELTGLYNRRGFNTLAAQELNVAKRAKTPCALFSIDLDGLKNINDRLGHAAGDEAIILLSEQLRISFRNTDVICRLGGDEFVVFAYNCAEPEILRDRISINLQHHNKASPDGVQISASVGFVPVDPDSQESLDSHIGRADEVMYSIKEASGRGSRERTKAKAPRKRAH